MRTNETCLRYGIEIRKIINIFKKKKGNKVINCIQNGNNMTVNSPKEIAEELNNHFTSVVKNIEKKLFKPSCDFSKFLRDPNKGSFIITSTKKAK